MHLVMSRRKVCCTSFLLRRKRLRTNLSLTTCTYSLYICRSLMHLLADGAQQIKYTATPILFFFIFGVRLCHLHYSYASNYRQFGLHFRFTILLVFLFLFLGVKFLSRLCKIHACANALT